MESMRDGINIKLFKIRLFVIVVIKNYLDIQDILKHIMIRRIL